MAGTGEREERMTQDYLPKTLQVRTEHMKKEGIGREEGQGEDGWIM